MALALSSEALSLFYAGEIDRVELVYTSFISMIASVQSIRTLVPLTPQGIETADDEIFKMSTKVTDAHHTRRTPPAEHQPHPTPPYPAPHRPTPPTPTPPHPIERRLHHVQGKGSQG